MDKAEKVFTKIAAPLGKQLEMFSEHAPNTFKKFLGSGFAKRLGLFGAGLIISQFVEELIVYLKERSVEAKSPKYYNKMLERNPQLMEKDPEEVAALWATLYKTAPNLAQDPIAAGAFITQNINKEVLKEHAGPPIDTFKTLVDIESSISKNKKPSTSDTTQKFWNVLNLGSSE